MHSNFRLLTTTKPTTSSSMLTTPFSLQSFLPCSIINKRYSSGGRKDPSDEKQEEEENIIIDHVRAPSLADEFKRMEGEKSKEDDHLHEVEESGIASQTVGKTMDGLDEALGKENKEEDLESVKNRYKEHEPGADYRRRGTNTASY